MFLRMKRKNDLQLIPFFAAVLSALEVSADHQYKNLSQWGETGMFQDFTQVIESRNHTLKKTSKIIKASCIYVIWTPLRGKGGKTVTFLPTNDPKYWSSHIFVLLCSAEIIES